MREGTLSTHIVVHMPYKQEPRQMQLLHTGCAQEANGAVRCPSKPRCLTDSTTYEQDGGQLTCPLYLNVQSGAQPRYRGHVDVRRPGHRASAISTGMGHTDTLTCPVHVMVN